MGFRAAASTHDRKGHAIVEKSRAGRLTVDY